MEVEKGVIMVVFKEMGRTPRFAVLKRKKNWEGWEIPKGHLEDEDYEETVKTELQEEVGIEERKVEEVLKINHTVEWEFEGDGEKVKRKYKAFIVKVDESALIDTDENPHEEHEKGHFLNYDDAQALLTYEEQAELLSKANSIIQKEF